MSPGNKGLEVRPAALGTARRFSFRDPRGRAAHAQGRILRVVSVAAAADLEEFLNSVQARELVRSGRLVRTEILRLPDNFSVPAEHGRCEIVLDQEPFWFPSFPCEWPPEMLHAAGLLTLDLAQELLRSNRGLKDASPYNVLFRGAAPVFVDWLSVERRNPRDPVWLPEGQFAQNFLLPLLVHRHAHLPLAQLFSSRRDGLQPQEVYDWLTLWEKLRPPFLTLVSMPTWLARLDRDDGTICPEKPLANPEQARSKLESAFKRLRRALQALAPQKGRRSQGPDGAVERPHSPPQFASKQAYLVEVARAISPQRVLDIGCSTGHFSALIARSGASVVAVDSDPVVVGEAWRRSRAEKLDMQALVVDFVRPTPALGWRNQECPSFLDRSRNAFDTVLMLAVLDRMLAAERIPLAEIIDLAAELTTAWLVIEWISPEDPEFRRLARGRGAFDRDLTLEVFERACRRRFEVVSARTIQGAERRAYLLRKKG